MEGLSDNKALALDSLHRRLTAHGCEFDFFQAVWLLERYTDIDVHVGERGPIGKESFRFRPDVSMGFPATDIRRVSHVDDRDRGDCFYQIDVTFLGLYGVATPLPLHYAVDVLRSVETYSVTSQAQGEGGATSAAAESGSTPIRDFLDIFHHRIVSLFYRSWLKYRYDRSFGMPGRDHITDYLLWLIGCSPDLDESAIGLQPVRMLRYAGVLTQRPRSATMLEGLLQDYWEGVDARVEQCVGRWVTIGESDQCRMGSANSGLGTDITVGEQVYDLNGSFCISLGPMDWETYLSFLPGTACYSQTRSLAAFYCTDPLSFSVELHLQAGEIPEMKLTSGTDGSRLGLTSWVRTDEMPETRVLFDESSTVAPEPSGPATEEAREEVAV